MAHSSDTNLTLDQSQQTEADTSSASVGILGLLHQSPMNTDIMANSSEAELAHAQSKRTGEDTSATSAKSANVQEYEAPAVAAVLHTNELLHLIIAEVPREHRTSLRRVSKQWQAAVVRAGYALEPITSCEDLAASIRNGVPMYEPPRKTLKVNPAWPHAQAYSDYPRELYCLPYDLSYARHSVSVRLAAHGRESITEPPITQVSHRRHLWHTHKQRPSCAFAEEIGSVTWWSTAKR
jgi:hypothetical protein